MLAVIPNMPLDDVPDGKDEHGNVEVRRWGEPPTWNFEPRQHFDIGEWLGQMDFETAAKIAGARFMFIKGNWPGWSGRLASSCSTCRPASMATPNTSCPTWCNDAGDVRHRAIAEIRR